MSEHKGLLGRSTRSGADGRFELSGLGAGVTYDFSVSASGKVRTKMRVEAGASGLRVAIETGFAASGRLVGADGKPLANTQLRFVAQGHEAPEAHAEPDADGRFAVDGLRDGEYRVETWPDIVRKPGDPATASGSRSERSAPATGTWNSA
jgi:hypothetical protein